MNRKLLAEAGGTIARFFASGVMELKDKLGPINWQLEPSKPFEPADFEAFLKLLPRETEGRKLRHVVEVRHDSFRSPNFLALVREHEVAVVIAGDSAYPQIADATAPVRPYHGCEGRIRLFDAALDLWARERMRGHRVRRPWEYVEPRLADGKPRDATYT